MKNMGNTEKIIRLAVGAIIIGFGFYNKNWWGILGVLPILSAVTGYCFLSPLFSKFCCRSDKKTDTEHHDHHDHEGCCHQKH